MFTRFGVVKKTVTTATWRQVEWRSYRLVLRRPLLTVSNNPIVPVVALQPPLPPTRTSIRSPSRHLRNTCYFSSVANEKLTAASTSEEHNGSNDTSSSSNKPIRILFGSQQGTAQIFAMQLADTLEETQQQRSIEMLALNEPSSVEETFDPDAINVILASVAGQGGPPDNARTFYEWLLQLEDDLVDNDYWKSIQYTIFGLGNRIAHPNHFNVVAKNIDSKLQELGATRIHDVGLGDDGECIEDDFDVWLESLLQTLTTTDNTTTPEDESRKEEETEVVVDIPPSEEVDTKDTIQQQVIETPQQVSSPLSESGRVISTKYPQLVLEPANTDIPLQDLFNLQTTARPFYQSDVSKHCIEMNRLLNVQSAEYYDGLRELVVNLPDDTTYYEAGDHFVVYPKNPHCLVQAYIDLLGMDPFTVIKDPVDDGGKRTYPHPTGITLFDTLLHSVDLGAVPSPTFSRELLGRNDVNYKTDIANPRRTVLDLAQESKRPISLEDLLYNLTPMQPRYYSIASSPLVHPTQVYLTYRPVKYVSSMGAIREGTCTTYMTNLQHGSQIVGAVRSNPSFRLPQDPSVPVMLMAGGCGIAPIRSFLEDRLAQVETTSFGESVLYLGFRSPSDEVYKDLVDEALLKSVSTDVQVSYTSGCVRPDQHCRLVSDTVRDNSRQVWDLIENGGYIYLCGGARTFGAACEKEVIDTFKEHGNMNEEDAADYLQQLIKEGRFCEDLAD